MPGLGPFRCIVTLVSVGDTSGLRFQCPSRCTGVQIYINNTSGWADIDYFRCISFFRHYLIHRDSIIHGHSDVSQFKVHRDSQFQVRSDVSQLISREYTYILSQPTPTQAGQNKQNTSKFQVFIQSRCIASHLSRNIRRIT